MARSPGRAGRPWLRIRQRVIASYDACSVCGLPVDKTLSGRHPLGPSVDHVVALVDGGPAREVFNLRLVHTRCNSGKENRRRKTARDSARRW